MKKIIVLLSFIVMTFAVAEHRNSGEPVYTEMIPSICSTPKGIKAYIEHHNLKPVEISLGREGREPTGQPVFMITQYENEEGSQKAAVIDVPNGTQSCLLYHTFDLTTVNTVDM